MAGALHPVGTANQAPAIAFPAGNSVLTRRQYPALRVFNQRSVPVSVSRIGSGNAAIDKSARATRQRHHMILACRPQRARLIKQNGLPLLFGKAASLIPLGQLDDGLFIGVAGVGIQKRIEPRAASDPDAVAVVRLVHDVHRRNLAQVRHGIHHAIGNHRKIGKHATLGIVFQPVEPLIIDDKQMGRIFSRHAPRLIHLDRIPSRGQEPVTIPVVQIPLCTYPYVAARVGDNVVGVEFSDTLLPAVLLKARALKPVNAVFRCHPEKPEVVHGDSVD